MPGQVFAPAKNHATIAITTTLERFCRRGTITPVYAWAVLEVRLGVGEDEGCGHVSVRGVRGRGVHYRGRERGKGGAAEKHSTDISIFRALSFPIYFFMSSQPLGFSSDFSLLLSSLGLMLLLIPTLPPPIHPSYSVPCRSSIHSPSLLPFPFLISLSPALFPHVSPPFRPPSPLSFFKKKKKSPLHCGPGAVCNRDGQLYGQFELSQSFTANYNNRYQKKPDCLRI